MPKMLTFKFKIMDNTGGAISITSIKISEYPSGSPISATFATQPTYILATAAINNISGLPKMIKIEFNSSNGMASIIYDNDIDDPNVVGTVVMGGTTIYTRKGLIVLCTENEQNIPTISMVPPTYF